MNHDNELLKKLSIDDVRDIGFNFNNFKSLPVTKFDGYCELPNSKLKVGVNTVPNYHNIKKKYLDSYDFDPYSTPKSKRKLSIIINSEFNLNDNIPIAPRNNDIKNQKSIFCRIRNLYNLSINTENNIDINLLNNNILRAPTNQDRIHHIENSNFLNTMINEISPISILDVNFI